MDLGIFSLSLAVKDIAASKAFYEKLGFSTLGGDIAQNWLILKNGATVIGLFQGMFEKNMLTFNPGWDAADCMVAKTYGEAWQRSLRSLLLVVPSIVARIENNILINDRHPEFPRVTHGLHQPVWWDERLFQATPVGRARRR